MGAWRHAQHTGSPYQSSPRRSENWGSVRLEGEDDLASRVHSQSHVRSLGLGIEGRPSGSTIDNGRTSRAIRRASTLSVWTWAGKNDAQVTTEEAPVPSDGMFIPGERSKIPEPSVHEAGVTSPRRDRQIITTLALLEAFHTNTTAILSRLATLLQTRKSQQSSTGAQVVVLAPKDVMSFELGPFSGLDARFVEWLGEEYGGGIRVVVKRGWKDLVGLVLGLG